MRKESDHITGTVLFEGMTSIRAVIGAFGSEYNDRRIRRILVDESRKKSREKELSWLSYKAREMDFPIEFVSSEELDRLTTGSTHGGIVAECTGRTIPTLTADSLKGNGFYVMIDGVEDPYNFGYSIRSLYTSGADGIVLTPRNWMTAGGVVSRSSAGTSEMIPMYECSPTEAAEIFKSRGYKVVCAGIRDSVSSFDADLKKPIFLIVGGEKRGISAEVLSRADQVVRIDYGRPFAGSLSAATSASILGYEVMRNNRK